MAESRRLSLADDRATLEQGRRLGAALLAVRPAALMVFLQGELGAGKTTLVRGCLAALGHQGRVPSPTYTLIEPYELSGLRVFHVDLYRLRAAAEIEGIGLGEEIGPGAIALIEWPERGAGWLPQPDLRLRLEIVPQGRRLECEPVSAIGQTILDRWIGLCR